MNLATAIYQLAKRRVNNTEAVERMLERAAERINSDVSEFDARALANCAWGAVKLGSSNMRILDAVADATPRVLEDFNPPGHREHVVGVRDERRRGAGVV